MARAGRRLWSAAGSASALDFAPGARLVVPGTPAPARGGRRPSREDHPPPGSADPGTSLRGCKSKAVALPPHFHEKATICQVQRLSRLADEGAAFPCGCLCIGFEARQRFDLSSIRTLLASVVEAGAS